jgi:hypothetical protein
LRFRLISTSTGVGWSRASELTIRLLYDDVVVVEEAVLPHRLVMTRQVRD